MTGDETRGEAEVTVTDVARLADAEGVGVELTEAERAAITGAVVDTIHGAMRHFRMGQKVEEVVKSILAARDRARDAEVRRDRCVAMFPCHPTPEWPCDHPDADHRCALDADHVGDHVTPGGWRD